MVIVDSVAAWPSSSVTRHCAAGEPLSSRTRMTAEVERGEKIAALAESQLMQSGSLDSIDG